jgi:FKBP-type peptidyl-prolyl cis-trans isomerase FkpA
LDQKEFDKGDKVEFPLYQLIEGWQIGIPKFGKGGKGKLLVPSRLGYGSSDRGSIPANSTLIFDIELLDWK